jgi:type IV pilus assembly protein PilC
MPLFAYEAKDGGGKSVKGTIPASDKNAAQVELKKRSLTVLAVSEQAEGPRRGLFGLGGGVARARVKTKDIAIITRQLSTMISAGIPLLEALEIIHEQATDAGFRRVMNTIIERVRSGTDFSTALGEHPKIFTHIYQNMVRAGEAGGQLDTILQRLADYLESIEEIKREVKAAMTYPIISLALIGCITVGLVVGVVPRFKTIFDQLGLKELPLPTAFLLALSALMTNQWYLLLGGIIIVVTAFMMWKKSRTGARQWDWFLLNMPIFGQLFRKVAISRFTRTFSTLIQSGVPMLATLDIVSGTAGNLIIEEAVLKAKDAVTRGEPLGEPLAATKVFPPMVTRMIAIGEKTGALEKLLSKVSEFYDAEVKASVKSLTSLIEPLLIATMGIIVGGIVLAIFMPIMKIQQSLANK